MKFSMKSSKFLSSTHYRYLNLIKYTLSLLESHLMSRPPITLDNQIPLSNIKIRYWTLVMTDLIPIISTATAAAAFFIAAEVSTISTATTIIIMTYTQSLSKCSLVSSPSLLTAGSSDSYPAVLFSAFISRLFTPLLFTTSSASPPPLSHFTSLSNKCAICSSISCPISSSYPIYSPHH